MPPGMFLSQPPIDEHAVHPLAADAGLDAVGDHLARDQAVLHALGAHRHAVADRRRAEDLRVAAGLLDAGDGGVGELLQAGVAGRDRRVAVGDADHRLGEVALLVAHGVVHRAVRRARHAFGDVAGAAVDRHRGLGRAGGLAGTIRRCRRPALARQGAPRIIVRMLVHPQFDPIALDLSKIGLPIAIHWYGLTYLVAFGLFLFLAVRRSRLPQYAAAGWTRRDVEDLLFYGVLGTVIGGRLGYVLFYKPGYYAAQSARDLRRLEGRHGVPRRPARRDRRAGAVRAHAQAAVPRGHRPGRAVRADRLRRRPDRQLHQRRAVGALRRAPTCPGRWCSRSRARRCRAIRRSSTSSRSRACCCSSCSGSTARSRAASARCRARSSSATACCASSPSSSASPTASSACSRSA